MKKIVNLSVLIVFSFNSLIAQKNVIEKSEDQIKMFNAQQRFYAQDYQGALNIYTDVLKSKPNDGNLLFHIAECYFEMAQYDLALENAEKAKNADAKANESIPLLLGKLYHRDGKINEALAEYTAFKTSVKDSKKLKDSDVDSYIAQINTANEMMAKPVAVKIENLGTLINSKYDDKGPSITADGKTLIFNSRRPGKSSALDMEGDKKYFEDIYIATWDSIKNTWGEAELLRGQLIRKGMTLAPASRLTGKKYFFLKMILMTNHEVEIFITPV